jgi:Ca-activated chloride channel family protein
MRVELVVLIATLSCISAPAQDTVPHEPSVVIRQEVRLVTLTATVVDPQERNVPGLRKEDFRIFEDDKPQTISVFTAEEKPVSLGILFDTSGSMIDKIDDVQDAVKHFVNLVNPEDDIFLMRFSSNVRLVADVTADRKRIARAVGRLEPRGSTRLYDAIEEGLQKLPSGKHAKKALLVLTDGKDTASDLRLDDLLLMARKAEVLIYALGIGHGEKGSFGHLPQLQGDEVDMLVLTALAEATGGRSFYLEQAHQRGVDLVDKAVREVSAELRQQYTLGYYPANPADDGQFRRIRVETVNPELTVRTRKGYYAPRTAAH